MDVAELKAEIDNIWQRRQALDEAQWAKAKPVIQETINLLDRGEIRVAQPGQDKNWQVNQWVKKAVLLSFQVEDNTLIGGPGQTSWWDKVPSKFAGWGEKEFRSAGFRAVPGSIVRHGSYIAHNAILMPSFVNIGAYIGEGTLIDGWATVGSCAQIGANCHISGGAGIGGVLEPLQADPVIIEDDCFIGARSEIAEGVRIGQGAVLSMGVYIGASTKIVNRFTGTITKGFIPPYSVVVPGSLPDQHSRDGRPGVNLYCAVIVKQVDAQTRAKTAINELLRD